MATDIARLSFDAGRHYTGVVRQQGRVTLEAEENEALAIDLVERRAELLDIIGPAGTPDDGYGVSQGTGFDLIIGTGVMYVGGNRVELDTTLDYAHQPDWLDAATDPDWVPVPESAPPANEWIVLVVQERDVTAVEDPVLREVALGGPDGAARLRLLQHVERLATEADTCREAAGAQNKIWLEEDGLRWEPSLGVLASMTRLQVTWSGSTTPPDPCEPSAVGGYLGAQNQAFRVQINAVHTANGTVDLLWGPDDASMLYRVTSDGTAQPTLTFANTPVDAYHQPSMGQAVEVLRDAAQLASTDGVVEGYVASLTGQPFVLTDSYQPDARTLQLPSAITLPGAGDPSQTPQLYLRAWQGLLAGQPLDTPIALPGTGLEVTITTIGAAAAHRGDYWVIAARPAVPTNVFPARLLREGQPPDGPLQWACPLGIVGWTDGLLVTVDDCRKPFNPLTDATAGGGCCTLTVTPDNGQGLALQELIDKATAGRVVGERWTHVTVCLRPGRYLLERPLLLRHLQSRLTIEACGGAAVLAAAEPQTAIFAEGLIVVTDAQEVTLSGLEIELPLVPYTKTGAGGLDLTHLEESLREFYVERAVGFGVRAVQAEGLTITGCTFRFHVGLATEARALADDQPAHVYAVGVLAQAECWNLTLEANRFAGTRHVRANRGRASAATKAGRELAGAVETHLLAGFLLSPSLLFKSSDAAAYEPIDQAAAHAVAASAGKTARATKAVKATKAPARSRARTGATTAAADQGLAAFPSGGLVRSVFDGASIRENVFEELTIGIAAFADLGRIDIENNQFRRCYGAVWLFSMRAQASMDLVNAYAVADDQTEAAQNLASFSSAALLDPSVLLASVLGRTMPLPAGYSPGNRLRARVAQEVIAEAHHTDPAAWTAAFLETALSQLTDVRSPNVQPVPTPDKDTGSAKADTGGADPAASAQTEATPKAGEPTATGDQEESDVPAPPAGWFQVDQTPRTVSPIEANLAAAHVVMSEFEREVAVEPARDHFELRLADNDMDCVTRASDTSGPVLAIWDFVGGDVLPGGSAIVAANRIVGAAAWVALLAGATRVAVTGNIVVNTRKGGRSLGVVHALGGAAITGNVFTGHPLLPLRPAYTAPFNTWLPMNELL